MLPKRAGIWRKAIPQCSRMFLNPARTWGILSPVSCFLVLSCWSLALPVVLVVSWCSFGGLFVVSWCRRRLLVSRWSPGCLTAVSWGSPGPGRGDIIFHRSRISACTLCCGSCCGGTWSYKTIGKRGMPLSSMLSSSLRGLRTSRICQRRTRYLHKIFVQASVTRV